MYKMFSCSPLKQTAVHLCISCFAEVLLLRCFEHGPTSPTLYFSRRFRTVTLKNKRPLYLTRFYKTPATSLDKKFHKGCRETVLRCVHPQVLTREVSQSHQRGCVVESWLFKWRLEEGKVELGCGTDLGEQLK